MKRYLLCQLDDESYSYPDFKFFKTLKEAKQYCKEMSEKEWKMEFEKNEKSYRYDANWCEYYDDNRFFVNEIIPVEVNNGDSLVVWHHAYDGVDFVILHKGIKSECIEFMQKNAKQTFLDYGDDPDIDESDFNNTSEICFDTGTEWEMWSVVEFKEKQK